jgi:acyl dehydratase
MSSVTSIPDWIPQHLSPAAREQLFELTKSADAGAADIECSENLIRHYCETLEDGNPLYHDADYARSRGFRDVVAQPGMLIGTLSTPYRWPWPPKEQSSGGNVHYKVKKLMGLPVGVVVDNEVEFVRFVEIGDRLNRTTRLASITGPKTTRLGEGWFWVIETTCKNQKDEVVATMRMTMFAYNPHGAVDDDGPEPDGRHPATEERLRADEVSHPDGLPTRFWDDVEEGDELPTLFMPITVTRCVYLASATRDFAPHHHNRDYAQQEVHARDMFLNTPFNMGILARFLTDWSGPQGLVRRLKLAMRENICAGDDMSIDGTVTRKYVEGDEHGVDVAIVVSTQHGPAYEASATVLLPAKA